MSCPELPYIVTTEIHGNNHRDLSMVRTKLCPVGDLIEVFYRVLLFSGCGRATDVWRNEVLTPHCLMRMVLRIQETARLWNR